MKFILSMLLLLSVSACGSFNSVTQLEEQTYLQLAGNVDNVILTLDDGSPVQLGGAVESFNLNGKTITKFKVKPGQHVIKLERHGQLLVHRKIFVSEGNSAEINIP